MIIKLMCLNNWSKTDWYFFLDVYLLAWPCYLLSSVVSKIFLIWAVYTYSITYFWWACGTLMRYRAYCLYAYTALNSDSEMWCVLPCIILLIYHEFTTVYYLYYIHICWWYIDPTTNKLPYYCTDPIQTMFIFITEKFYW